MNLPPVDRELAPPRRVAQIESPGMTLIAWRLLWGLARLLPDYGRRKVRGAVERRRMCRIRRDPTTLARALASAKQILIVCHGNIIRSAFAARLIAQAVGDDARIAIFSAGLQATPGNAPHPTALDIAARLGVDLSGHASARVEPEMVAKADLIFVMDIPQLIVMRRRFPEARGRTYLLTCLASEAPLEVHDPFDGDESAFEACFDQISRAVRPIVRILCDKSPREGADAAAAPFSRASSSCC
jgi:protein-tyrosine-phosphatase